MMYQSLDKSHFFPGVLHDDNWILRGTPEEVGSEDHGEVGGVHLGDVDHVRLDEGLEEVDEEHEDSSVKVRKLLDE